MEPSHVLRAMGVEPRFVKGALRLSLGHTTTEDDITHAVHAIVNSVKRLRNTQ
jgi:cysteine desulfurase